MKLEEFNQNSAYEVEFTFDQKGTLLTLNYTIMGNIAALFPPLPVEKTAIREGHDLWKKTCFECFFFSDPGESYTELNFNIHSEYAFLHFESYRIASQQQAPFKILNISPSYQAASFEMRAQIDVPPKRALKVSPTLILMPKGQETQYFALAHGTKPDFHARQPIESIGFQVLS